MRPARISGGPRLERRPRLPNPELLLYRALPWGIGPANAMRYIMLVEYLSLLLVSLAS